MVLLLSIIIVKQFDSAGTTTSNVASLLILITMYKKLEFKDFCAMVIAQSSDEDDTQFGIITDGSFTTLFMLMYMNDPVLCDKDDCGIDIFKEENGILCMIFEDQYPVPVTMESNDMYVKITAIDGSLINKDETDGFMLPIERLAERLEAICKL